MILIDTGPLVSLFDPRDPDHRDCHRVLADITEPLFTTVAVVTEVLHLLYPGSRGAEGFKEFVMRDFVTCQALDKTLLHRCFELMDKYADLPMDFADATLVAVAEKLSTRRFFTLDIKDFNIYKIKKGHRHNSAQLVGTEYLT